MNLAPLHRLRDGRPWLTNVALCLLGFGMFLAMRQFPNEYDHYTVNFSGLSAILVILYAGAVGITLTQPTNRATFGIIVGFAIFFNATVYMGDPFTSSDLYRYVWDGIVQHAHINPYRYIPADPALQFLREPNQDIYDNINRKEYARTIYPPIAQMIYWLVTFVSPTVAAMKLGMLSFIAGSAAVLLALLRHLGRRREEILLFLWCPALVWEIALVGHIDAAVIFFICLALLFRYRSQPLWTGVFLGLAIFTKFYPAVLFPALYTRRDWKMPAAIVGIGAAGYALYSSAGALVLGFAAGYSKEEGMDTGTRYYLLQQVQRFPWLHALPMSLYLVFCALVFGVLTLWAWKKATIEVVRPEHYSWIHGPVFLRISAAFAFALMLLFSPHYPWYVLWLVPFYTLLPELPMLTYVCLLFFLLNTVYGDPAKKLFEGNQMLYASVAAMFLLQWALRKWRLWEFLHAGDRAQAAEVRP